MKMIVADDERWVRAAIINTIPFVNLHLELISEASNGLEALELCKKYKPDILLTDIRMPGLTGLELIKELKQILPNIKIIIISGYDDFEYAKTAIKLGVSDYILKPVDEVEIEHVLSNVINTINIERSREAEEVFLRIEYKKTLPFLHEKLMNTLIKSNSLTVEAIKRKLNKYQINFKHKHFTVLVFSPDDTSVLTEENNNNYKALIRRVIKHYLGGITFLKIETNFEMVAVINHTHYALLPQEPTCNTNLNQTVPKPSTEVILHDNLNKALDLCQRIYSKKFNNTFSIGISSASRQIKSLPALYNQASEALLMRFWESYGKVFFFQPELLTENLDITISQDIIDNIALNIKLSDYLPAHKFINNLYNNQKIFQKIKPQQIKEFFWAYVQSLITKLNVQLSFIEYETSLTGIHPYEKIRSFNSIEQLIPYAKNIIIHIYEHYQVKNPVTSKNLIENAKQIIEENYCKDINLDQVAKYVKLNSAYFSELFKKETGMSFIDYKTHLKVENAKKLLIESNLNIYEISSKVGYTDSKYFSKLFKKITGFTPYEFKEKNKASSCI